MSLFRDEPVLQAPVSFAPMVINGFNLLGLHMLESVRGEGGENGTQIVKILLIRLIMPSLHVLTRVHY